MLYNTTPIMDNVYSLLYNMNKANRERIRFTVIGTTESLLENLSKSIPLIKFKW